MGGYLGHLVCVCVCVCVCLCLCVCVCVLNASLSVSVYSSARPAQLLMYNLGYEERRRGAIEEATEERARARALA